MFGSKRRKQEIDDARARVRDLEAAITEKRKPSESRPPPTGATRSTQLEPLEQFTPGGTRRIGFVPRG